MDPYHHSLTFQAVFSLHIAYEACCCDGVTGSANLRSGNTRQTMLNKYDYQVGCGAVAAKGKQPEVYDSSSGMHAKRRGLRIEQY